MKTLFFNQFLPLLLLQVHAVHPSMEATGHCPAHHLITAVTEIATTKIRSYYVYSIAI